MPGPGKSWNQKSGGGGNRQSERRDDRRHQPSTSASASGQANPNRYQQQNPRNSSYQQRNENDDNTKFVPVTKCPDPYNKPCTKKQLEALGGWKKEFDDFENKDDIVLQVKPKGPGGVGSWENKKEKISVNYYEIESTNKNKKAFPISTLYHYDIKFQVDRKRKAETDSASKPGKSSGAHEAVEKIPPKYITDPVLKYLVEKLGKNFGFYGIGTDGRKNMYTICKLDDLETPIPLQHEVTFDELKKSGFIEDEDNERGTIQVTFEPAIDKTSGGIHTIDVAPFAQHWIANGGSLEGLEGVTVEQRPELEAALNALMRNLPNFKHFSVGRSTVVPVDVKSYEKKVLGGGVVAVRGMYQSATIGWKPYLNVDITHSAFLLDKNVLEVLKDLFGKSGADPYNVWTWADEHLEQARSLLKSCKIRYVAGNSKLGGTVTNVHWDTPINSGFHWEDRKEKEKQTTFFDYFKEKYGTVLKYKDGPLLEIGNKGNRVPAELCIIKSGQSYNRKLNGDQTSEMLKIAAMKPNDRKNDIQRRMDEMDLKNNKTLKAMEVKLSDKMLQIDARVLAAPTLRYGPANDNDKMIAHVTPNDGVWNIYSKREFDFYQPAREVKKWGILQLCYRRLPDTVINRFVSEIVTVFKMKGVEFPPVPTKTIFDVKCKEMKTAVDKAGVLRNYFVKDFKDCDVVIVVTGDKKDPIYGPVKNAAEILCKPGKLTSCIWQGNLTDDRRFKSVVKNLILKINMKLGGINHVIVPPLNSNQMYDDSQFCRILMDCPTLILGADVTHPPAGFKKEDEPPSFAAVVGSLGNTGMEFMTEVRAQRKVGKGAAEVIQDFEAIITKIMKAYERKLGMLPLKIIYYRDGVGEGQFKELLHVEMKAIRNACMALRNDYQPKITFISVNKRHHTRFFHEWGNAPVGTVVDTHIVHPSRYQFYGLFHKGIQGTSIPGKYDKLWDDSNLSPDQFQNLTNSLCYMFARCTRSVKIPAPTYYAHLAAERAKKLCEGFDSNKTMESLNEMLAGKMQNHPMHFI